MKKYSLLLLLVLLLPLASPAKIKVVQRSAKKAPVWVNNNQKDYIITSAISETIEKARKECLDQVRKYMIDAVAQNIQSTSQSNITQESVNTSISNFLDTYTSSLKTQSANIPYLTGISASKIEDTYWEQRLNTDNKKTDYVYSIKYPFPAIELKKLVYEFNRRDAEMNQKFKMLEEEFHQITSVEQINKAINDLNPLINYFFDDIRKNAAVNLQQSYRTLFNQIIIHELSNSPGQYEFELLLNGKPVRIMQRPILKSETFTQLQAEPLENKWRITYSFETCDPSEENSAMIIFKVGGKPLQQHFFTDVAQSKPQVFPAQEVYLTAKTVTDSTLNDVVIIMNIESKTKAYIQSLTLTVPGLNQPLFLSGMNIETQTKGAQKIRLVYQGLLRLREKQNLKTNLLRGYMMVADQNQTTHRVDFSLPYKSNW